MTTRERIYWGRCTARAVSAGIMYGSDAIAKMGKLADDDADHYALCSAYRLELIRMRQRFLKMMTSEPTRSAATKLFRVAAAINRYDEQRP